MTNTTVIPETVSALMAAFTQLQSHSDWVQSIGEVDERAWQMTALACDTLHNLGVDRIPSSRHLVELLDRVERDRCIYAQFNGRNHAALAKQYGLTTRTIRRIVER